MYAENGQLCSLEVINREGLRAHRIGPHPIYHRHKHLESYFATYFCQRCSQILLLDVVDPKQLIAEALAKDRQKWKPTESNREPEMLRFPLQILKLIALLLRPMQSSTPAHLLHLFLYLFLHLFLPPCLRVAVTVSVLQKRPSSVSPVQVQMMHRRSAVPWVWCLKNSQERGHQMPLHNKRHRKENPNQTKAGW